MADLFYPQSLEDALDEAWEENAAVSAIRFDIHHRDDAFSSHVEKSIYLYIPENMNNPTNVSWDSAPVGPGGAAVMDGGTWMDAANIGQQFLKYKDSLIAGIRGKLSGGSDIDNDTLSGASAGFAWNPFIKMVFRNINFRTFSFNFKFTPHNNKESAKIHEIIQEFRQAAHPASDASGEACTEPNPTSFRMGYPKEISIEYVYQGDTHPWLNRFKRCVITDLNVNYTSAGFYATMRDGFPAQTELSMTFSEIELVYREDICSSGPSY